MRLVSIQFAIFFTAFFTVFWAVHYLMAKNQKKRLFERCLLLCANLAFCYLAGIKVVLVLLYCCVITFLGGFVCSRHKNKGILTIFIALLLAPLILLKYLGFFSSVIGFESPVLFVPLGISFYTLQSITYLISVYKDELQSQSIITVSAFVSFFPLLSSGPIARAKGLIPQFCSEKEFNYDEASAGMIKIAIGLIKKLVIADSLGLFINKVYYSVNDVNRLFLVCGVLLYSFQIYFDFSGYSDIAFGLASLLGFKVPENFNKPYLSGSIGEFWRNWHISLSSWFRDYIYIPLGGNRVSEIRQYLNIMVVFLVSGLWHGADWHFVVWGLLHGLVLCLEKLFGSLIPNKITDRIPRILRIIYTYLIATIAWIFFRADSIHEAGTVLKRIFTGTSFYPDSFILTGSQCQQFLIGLLFMAVVLVIDILTYRNKESFLVWLRKKPMLIRWLIYVGIVFIVIFFSVKEAIPNFIYTGF